MEGRRAERRRLAEERRRTGEAPRPVGPPQYGATAPAAPRKATPLAELRLPRRVHTTLSRAGIETIEQLTSRNRPTCWSSRASARRAWRTYLGRARPGRARSAVSAAPLARQLSCTRRTITTGVRSSWLPAGLSFSAASSQRRSTPSEAATTQAPRGGWLHDRRSAAQPRRQLGGEAVRIARAEHHVVIVGRQRGGDVVDQRRPLPGHPVKPATAPERLGHDRRDRAGDDARPPGLHDRPLHPLRAVQRADLADEPRQAPG